VDVHRPDGQAGSFLVIDEVTPPAVRATLVSDVPEVMPGVMIADRLSLTS
jgi:hypothetical protein